MFTATPSEPLPGSAPHSQSGSLLDAFAERLMAPIGAPCVEELFGHMEQAHAAGHMSGAHIEIVRLLVRHKRAAIKQRTAESRASSSALRWPERKRPKRIALRRWQAASSYLPAKLAQHFTLGQQAVLAVVGPLAATISGCRLTLATIARRAGVCVTTARDALRLARLLGLVMIEERRVRGARSLPNVVRVTRVRWKTWLLRRREMRASAARKAEGGSKNADTVLNKKKAEQDEAPKREASGAAARDAREFGVPGPFASPRRRSEGAGGARDRLR